MRPGASGPFICSSVVGDSFLGEVFGVGFCIFLPEKGSYVMGENTSLAWG